ncbi:MAG: hypothetical protein F6K36_01425 [Symploca sp. SIO3C6]|nr:hypothetical protein [Symploca sp. SIO3C6]
MTNPNSLENELKQWNQLIRSQPNNPKAYIQRGMANFKLAKIDESIRDFDHAEKLNPKVLPYLWQRGLSYYYAERFEEGARQFQLDLSVNPQDVEETVWRYLCIARLKGVAEARNSLLAVKNDPRSVMRSVYGLFAGNCTREEVLAVGEKESIRGKFYSNLYIGLHYEAQADSIHAREYIVRAANDYQLDDYMWHLARVHQALRGWF